LRLAMLSFLAGSLFFIVAVSNGELDRPQLDKALAKSYIGKHLLVGITYLDHNDNFIEQKQVHGIILRINEIEGVVLRLKTGEEFKLPPDLRGFQQAPKGEYRLRSTGEIVVDPDLISNWTFNRPAPKN